MHVYCAGHSQSAQEKRHQCHEREKIAEASQGIVESRLVIGHGVKADAQVPQAWAPLFRDRLRIPARRQPDKDGMLDPGTEAEEAGGVEIGAAHECPGAERITDSHVAGYGGDRADDLQPRLSHGDAVAGANAERGEEGRIYDDMAAGLELAPCACGSGLDGAIEGPAPGDRAHLGEPSRFAGASVCHRAEAGHLRFRASDRIESVAGQVGQGTPRLEGEIGAEELPGLARNRIAQVRGKTIDGHQRCDASRDASGEQE